MPLEGAVDWFTLGGGDAPTTCARDTRGIQCWGSNAEGEIGDGTTEARLAPTAVSGLTDAKGLSVKTIH